MSAHRQLFAALLCALGCAACGGGGANSEGVPQAHSSALALDASGTRLFVAHPDADSVSLIDLATRRILREQPLGKHPPARDADGRYQPAVQPRALALNTRGDVLYVSGERSGRLYALSSDPLRLVKDAFVCAEPIGVLVSADDQRVFVACSQDDEIVELDATTLSVVARVACPRKPWALAWDSDGESLLATHLLGPGVTRFHTRPLALDVTWTLADGPPVSDGTLSVPHNDATEPHGVVRGIYDLALRPGTRELWVAHLMLGIDTPQPELDFKRTVFPALSLLDSKTGEQRARLSVQANPGDGGAFGDVVSGPHALAFSDDGALAFVVDSDSEDLLVIDADSRIERALVRPLPGHMPEAVVFSHGELYVQERNSEEIAAFSVERGADQRVRVRADGAPFASLRDDPMPASLRLGQKLFYSANSDDAPITQNHWVACASCHLEGRSDAVTWRFGQGPRDTPSNAGGLLDTGFLFRTADRTRVQDYWRTIDIEQGGHFDGMAAAQQPLLDALADYVNYAIPTPIAPSRDATHELAGEALQALRDQGEAVFSRIGCGACHGGPALTDSGAGNPGLDLNGSIVAHETEGGVLLHEMTTCVTLGDAPDVEHMDIAGNMRAACAFDTPQLRGLWDSAPYLHDGSAASLADVLPSMFDAIEHEGEARPALSSDEQRALLEYLRGL